MTQAGCRRGTGSWLLLSVALAASCISGADWFGKGTDAGARKFELVAMTDGTGLATDVYLPTVEGGPWPAILVRSTYGRDFDYSGYIKDGYAVVVQDVRGMGGSMGKAHVFYYDGWRNGVTDGADTVAWIKAQPWCNGRIGTYGESALAMTQVMMAPATHDLAAQYLCLVPSNFYSDVTYHGGVFLENLVEGWLFLVGQPEVTTLYKSHPRYDEFWSYYDAIARASEITAPGLFVNGWYDIFAQGTINGFLSREKEGGEGARGNNYLIMRWTAHLGDDTDEYRFNENRHSLDIGRIRKQFMAAHLKGDEHALDGIPKVHYYVMGDDRDPNAPGNEWRSAETWPPYPTTEKPFYLAGDNTLRSEALPDGAASLGYTFDPHDPYPNYGGANLMQNMKWGPYDQRKFSTTRKDLLKFETSPLQEPLEITGRVRVHLHVSSDAPDTDFTAKLVDVFPEGDSREILMLDNIRRVKTRFGFDGPAPLLKGPDELVELDIDLWSIAWVFNKGHRIGLHISSSNWPRYEVNCNTGADHPVSGCEMRVAHNRVHMDKTHPSALYLPVKAAE